MLSNLSSDTTIAAGSVEIWAEALREWARTNATAVDMFEDAPEPWILVEVGDPWPYWAGLGKGDEPQGCGWTADLSKALRCATREEALEDISEDHAFVAIPLSRAEVTAYPNGKPAAPRSAVVAPGTPASPVAAAEAAQGPTAGERVADLWWSTEPEDTKINTARLGGMIDALVAQAVREATFAADEHVRAVESDNSKLRIERDAYANSYERANRAETERDSLTRDVADLTESRAVALRERDTAKRMADWHQAARDRACADLATLREGIAALISGQKGRG